MKSELTVPYNLTCGYFDCSSFRQLKVSPQRRCETFEVEYFLEDGKNTFSDGVAYPIRKNFVLICTPGEERYSELPFKTKYLKFSCEGKLAEVLRHAPKYFHVSNSIEANELLDSIASLCTLNRWDSILLHGRLLTYVSLLLSEANRQRHPDAYKSRTVRDAEEYIKEHFAEDIKLSDIASAVNLSPNYFHTLFSEVREISPREYLENYRIKVAQELLLTTELPLSEISSRCGFSTQQYLTSVFKSRTGMTPTAFRHQQQSKYII
ncbi:MAG: helix-turn-helix transcriptional regulator [Clostridia bacterium]|nr:helix-turn-helix transcriptional regulator [Clostridia bacterium]